MKKIAIVIAGLVVGGGAEKVAADLANAFVRRGNAVVVVNFCPLEPGETCHPVDARVVSLDLPGKQGGMVVQLMLLLQRAWRFRRFFRQEGFDHVFAFLEAANAPTALAEPRAVLSVHSNPQHMSQNEWRLFRWLYPRARRVVAVSQQMQHLLGTRAGLRNVRCIYNPVDTQHVLAKAVEPLAVEGDFIVAVGRLEHPKNFGLLLDAFAQTALRAHCRLLLVGEGSERPALEAQIQALGLVGQAQLVGFDANPYRYMRKARFLVMSSRYEGYPLVLIEALCVGCPVIATDCPTGPREIVQQGENGLLVEMGNPGALAAAMDSLFFDGALREKFHRYAPLSVQGNDLEAVADAWLAAAGEQG